MPELSNRIKSGILAVAGCLLFTLPAAAQYSRVSTKSDGSQATGGSCGPHVSVSADGRFVAFVSAMTDLVPGDGNASRDVFVKDRQTGETTRVSVASDGTERTGDSGFGGLEISADGNIVAFTSRAAFVADDTNTCTAPAGETGPSCSDI